MAKTIDSETVSINAFKVKLMVISYSLISKQVTTFFRKELPNQRKQHQGFRRKVSYGIKGKGGYRQEDGQSNSRSTNPRQARVWYQKETALSSSCSRRANGHSYSRGSNSAQMSNQKQRGYCGLPWNHGGRKLRGSIDKNYETAAATQNDAVMNVDESFSRVTNNNNSYKGVHSFADHSLAAVAQSSFDSFTANHTISINSTAAATLCLFDSNSWVRSGKNRKQPVLESKLSPLCWDNLDSLRIVRPSLVASIYDGDQCASCPLRFSNSTKDYSSHLDWHFGQNRKKKDFGVSRFWYSPLDLWLSFNGSNSFKPLAFKAIKNGTFHSDKNVTQPTVRESKDESGNSCTVCGDKFEIFYDDDEQEWLLRNASETESGNCHPVCLPDL